MTPIQRKIVLFTACMALSCSLGLAKAGELAPEQARRESQMLQFGEKWCKNLLDPNYNGDKLAGAYYDAAQVYYQIADHTRNAG